MQAAQASMHPPSGVGVTNVVRKKYINGAAKAKYWRIFNMDILRFTASYHVLE